MNVIKYLSIILIYFIFFFWFKFIRERVPHTIPFNLTMLSSTILLLICINLSYIIFYKFFKKKGYSVFNEIIKEFQQYLEYLDQEFKTLTNIKVFYEKYSLIFVRYLLTYYYMLFICEITLKGILACIFIYDIYNHKLFLIYKFIWLYIFIYLFKYIKISLILLKKDRMYHIKECSNILIGSNTLIEINEFINKQTNKVLTKQPIINYILILRANYLENLYKQLGLKKGQIINGALMVRSLRGVIAFIIRINTILVLDKQLNEQYGFVTILITSIYLIGWFYILVVSLPTFFISINELFFIQCFQDNIEPFSDIIIKRNHEKFL